MAPPKKRGLPKPLPEGFILTDTEKKKWKLGRIIGQGGFGLIYLASSGVDRPVAADTDFVIKVEYQENGPLFSELKFYQRAAKPESMQKWKQRKNLDFLGIPTYWGSGLSEYNDLRYRFMVMDRLGSDLQKVCERNGGRMKKATVLQLGQGLVTILEYIHENEYVHADIKAANLMLGYKDPEQVYLADYGLSYRYCPDGVHKEYKENPKKGHNGTIEYTSIDAHKGLAPSRRGDLQILGFCLLHWLCGSLPWDNLLKNPAQVQEAKARLMDHLPDSVLQLSAGGASTDEVAEFLMYVKTLDYQNKPDYQYLKAVLASGTGRLDFSIPQGAARGSSSKVQDPPRREKKAGRARGGSKAKAVPMERDDDEDEEEESEEENQVKPKPVPACYIRGPPLNKPQPQQREAEVLPAGGRSSRSLRPRSEHVNYREKDSDDDDDDDDKDEKEDKEEEVRPRPIPACYVRGPPIGPRAQPKQKTKSKRPGRKTDDFTATSEREEGRCHPPRREHTLTNCDARSQTGTKLRERWRDRSHDYRVCSTRQWCHGDMRYGNTDHGGGWEGSALKEADPARRTGPLSWFVLVGAVLLLFMVQDLLV